jgi:4-carboxymuconolactone decarboxylase
MTTDDRIVRHRGWIAALLVALGAPQALIGLWALLAPRSFYGDFGPGGGWVSALGPYDEHLVRDVGALFVGLGVLMVLAAVRGRRSLTLVAVAVWLIFAVPHAIYHFFNLDPYTSADAVANAVSIVWTVVGPLIVLALLRRRPSVAPSPSAAARADGARIAGVPEGSGGPLVRYAYWYSRRHYGRVVGPTRVFAHHPLLLGAYGSLELAVERADRVDPRLKALAELKAATQTGCDFCIDIGSKLGRDAGVSERQLREFLVYRESDAFSPLERLVIDYAAAMTRTPVEVPDELFARMREHFDDAQLVELTATIATENFRGRFNWAFGLGSEGFAEGMPAPAPESAPA